MSGQPTTILVKPHIDGCWACRAVEDGRWTSPWFVLGDYVRRDSLGRKGRHGFRRWFVGVCNDPNCDAECLISADAVEGLGP